MIDFELFTIEEFSLENFLLLSHPPNKVAKAPSKLKPYVWTIVLHN